MWFVTKVARPDDVTRPREIKCIHKICQIQPRKPIIYTGKRPEASEIERYRCEIREQEEQGCFSIPEELSGYNDQDTWPGELQLWTYYVSEASNPRPLDIVKKLRKYYPDEEILMKFAAFLEEGLANGFSFKRELIYP